MSPYQSKRKSRENTRELQSGPAESTFTKSQSHEKFDQQARNSKIQDTGKID